MVGARGCSGFKESYDLLLTRTKVGGERWMKGPESGREKLLAEYLHMVDIQ